MQHIERHSIEPQQEDLFHEGAGYWFFSSAPTCHVVREEKNENASVTQTNPEYTATPRGAGIVGAVALLGALAGTLLWLTMLVGPVRLATGLTDARRQLQRAQDSLSAGQAKSAGFHVLAGSAAARRARAGLDANSPLLDLAAFVPAIDDALNEANHLVAAAEYSAAAATGTFDIANNALTGPQRIIQSDPENPDGSIVRLDRVEAMAETVTGVRNAVRSAREQLRAIDSANLPGRFRPAVSDGLREMKKSDEVLGKVERGFELLPNILGANGARSYLFGMQNSAELRGTGGALLQYALLTFDEGRASFERPDTVYEVDRDRRQMSIPLPDDAWYVRGIPDAQRFGNANWSPDWPLSARVTVDYARASSDNFPDVDGFIALDPTVLEKLVPGIGAYRTKWNNRISANSAVNFLLYKAYGVYPKAYVRRVALRQVVDGFFERILNPAHPTFLVEGLGKSLASKHIQIWLSDREEQRFVDQMKWSGKLARARDTDYIDVVQQNVGGNKLDYHAAQITTMDIAFQGSDSLVSTRVAVENNVFGPQTQWAMGNSGPLHRPMINLYVPGDAVLQASEISPPTCPECAALGQPGVTRIDAPPVVATWPDGRPIEHTELGKKVWTATLQIPPGREASFETTYTVPGVVRQRGGRSVYRLLVQHQPKVHPETMSITIELPDGVSDVRSRGFRRTGDTLSWVRRLQHDVALEVSWR
jgi:hypothetical protein